MSLRLNNDRRAMPLGQDELPILNAEEYVDGSRYRYPGSEVTPGRTTTSRSRAQPRNNSRANGSEESTAKRLRGRPRLDTKDETAADRRRTQIRLAQRAYRHRKDTAITSLEQKIKEMEMVQKSINEEISKLYELLLTEGIFDLAPHAEPRIRSVADGLLRLSSLPPGSDEHGSRIPGEANNGSDTSDARNSSSPPSYGSQTSFASKRGGATISSTSLENGFGRNLSGYEIITQATPENATFPSFYSGGALELSPSQVPGPHMRSHQVENTLYHNLPLPASYSYQERTFSRRFHRRTSERALMLATSPNPSPTKFASVFGFTLLFETKEVLVHRLLAVVRRTQDEELGAWRLTPRDLNSHHVEFLERQFGVGGLDGQYASMGPMEAETFGPSNAGGLDGEQRIQAIFRNFESHFLFPDDVERLLNKLGIYIPAYADVVEAEVDLDAVARAAQIDQGFNIDDPRGQLRGMNMGQTTSSGFEMSSMWIGNPPVVGRYDMSLQGEHAPSQAMHVGQMLGSQSGLTGGMTSFIAPDYTNMSSWPPASGPNKTKITIDIPKLIHEATSRCVCLGRTPGLRQRDLIKALRLASGLDDS